MVLDQNAGTVWFTPPRFAAEIPEFLMVQSLFSRMKNLNFRWYHVKSPIFHGSKSPCALKKRREIYRFLSYLVEKIAHVIHIYIYIYIYIYVCIYIYIYIRGLPLFTYWKWWFPTPIAISPSRPRPPPRPSARTAALPLSGPQPCRVPPWHAPPVTNPRNDLTYHQPMDVMSILIIVASTVLHHYPFAEWLFCCTTQIIYILYIATVHNYWFAQIRRFMID